jgi:undecaprenyl-diphosphatase
VSTIQAIVLAIVQGVTEFLPVSSSGHLILGSWLFDWPDQGLVFDGAVHLGTLGAVLIYFRGTWISLVKGCLSGGVVPLGDKSGSQSVPAMRLLWLLVLASVPLAIFGLLLKSTLEDHLRTPEAVGAFLLATSAMLIVAEYAGNRSRSITSVGVKDSVIIGIAQAASVIPGVSRSGTTIAAGMASNLDRDSAARLSFLMAVPALGGSGLLVIVDALTDTALDSADWGHVVLGAVIAFITGYLAIAMFLRMLRTASLKPFIVYTAVAGVAVLIARAAGA